VSGTLHTARVDMQGGRGRGHFEWVVDGVDGVGGGEGWVGRGDVVGASVARRWEPEAERV